MNGVNFVSTRRTVRFGGSTYVCLDKTWGIGPGEMVRIEVERVEPTEEAPEG